MISTVLAASTPVYVFGILVTGAVLWFVGRAIYGASDAHKQKQAQRAAAVQFPMPVVTPGQSPVTTSTATRTVVCTRCQHNFAVGTGVTSAVCPNCSATLPI
jgi:hypothetical protein